MQEPQLRLLAAACEHDEAGILIFDTKGIIHYVNSAFEKGCEVTRSELIGRGGPCPASSTQCEEIFGMMRDSLRCEDVRSARFTTGNAEGGMRVIEARVRPLRDEHGVVRHHVLVSREVTREALLERELRQAQKMGAIGALVGGIAHDFNNILGTVISCTEIALDDTPEESPVREDLEHVLKAGRRGKSLIRQILTFSRSHEQEFEPSPMEPIIKEVLKLLRASLPASIEIRRDIAPGAHIVAADPVQVHQILINLCTNAAHAMQAKGGVLEVSLAGVDIDSQTAAGSSDLHVGPYVKLTVRDTGHGMTPKVLERIFDPFFTTKKEATGTGLGLPVVQGIVRSHKGALLVESEAGVGTAFHVLLPAVEPGRDLSADAPFPSAPGGNETILLVDDEEDLIYAGEKALRRLGYEVFASSSSLEALELFRAQPERFDLVITDQNMPKMTGAEMAREMLLIRPGIPILLCTGFGPDSDEGVSFQEAQSIGIREVHMKPLERHEIAQAIRRVLDQSKQG
jgi:PAS domain S-box-containing protein